MKAIDPIKLPAQKSKALTKVSRGIEPILTDAARVLIDEWLEGWANPMALGLNSIPMPGPLLLHGPPGTGKTTVTKMIATRMSKDRPAVVLDALRVVGSHMGETTRAITEAADQALASNAVLVLEEIDTLAAEREYGSSAAVENTRATTAIMRLIERETPILLTSNRLDVLDPAIVRRCEYLVEMPEPTPAAKRLIVQSVLCDDPGPISFNITRAVTIAKRARRLACIRKLPGAEVFRDLARAEMDTVA